MDSSCVESYQKRGGRGNPGPVGRLLRGMRRGRIARVNPDTPSMKELVPCPASAEWRDGAFVLSSDAHSTAAVDCAFDRFGSCESFIRPAWA